MQLARVRLAARDCVEVAVKVRVGVRVRTRVMIGTRVRATDNLYSKYIGPRG